MEMMLTVLGQQGDYYNKWRYDGEPVDSEEFKDAINGLKKYFDEGIFSADVLDLDYASATEEFTNGDALVYYMGSWEAPLLSKTLRDKNGIELENELVLWHFQQQKMMDSLPYVLILTPESVWLTIQRRKKLQ